VKGRALNAAPAADTWEPVPQTLASGSASLLWVAVAPAVAAGLGWSVGQRMELARGTGARDGWLRISPSATPAYGRALQSLGRKPDRPHEFTVALAAPEYMQALDADRAICDYEIDGFSLLVRIPWDFGAAFEDPGEADE
jgi:hypothetical protein